MGIRFFLLNFIFASLFGALIFNLYQLQVEESGYYFDKAQARSEYQEELQLRRGGIFFTDKNNNDIPLSLNRDYPVIFASPKDIVNPEETARKVSQILDLDFNKLKSELDNPKSMFKLLAEKAEPEEIEAFKDLDIEGLHISYKQHRYYPFDSLASSLVGFVGVNDKYSDPVGLYGLELFYNDELRKGEDLYLTVDRNVQSESEKVLEKLMSTFNAVSGSIIVQEPSTGKILAMVNMPDFNPNNYSDYSISSFINPSIQHVYEPGSVFKPLTMAVGLDLEVLTPNTSFFDTGSVTLNGRTIRNWDKKAHGQITMTNVIERSVNTGAVFAVQRIGKENFLRYLRRFGFDQKTGINLPNEVSGSLNNLERKGFRDIDLATASFGQGTSVTSIQMISSYSVIANGGLLMKPILNKDESPQVIRRVISKEASEKVINMMESAVRKAQVAYIPQYLVAGKTGTAQIPDFEYGGYSEEYIHTFVGFAPASEPKFTILIKLDKPNVDLAGMTVVPAFKNLAQFLLNYYNIAPDDIN
ncbi:MAG: penicillin-binding protein 2 [Candidatus Paceibacterota bacterium]